MRMARVRVLPLVLALVPACGGGGSGGDGGSGGTPTAPSGGGTSTTPSTSSEIRVVDNSFSPSATTVAAGTAVTWTWAGAAAHDVTFDDGQKSATQVAAPTSARSPRRAASRTTARCTARRCPARSPCGEPRRRDATFVQDPARSTNRGVSWTADAPDEPDAPDRSTAARRPTRRVE